MDCQTCADIPGWVQFFCETCADIPGWVKGFCPTCGRVLNTEGTSSLDAPRCRCGKLWIAERGDYCSHCGVNVALQKADEAKELLKEQEIKRQGGEIIASLRREFPARLAKGFIRLYLGLVGLVWFTTFSYLYSRHASANVFFWLFIMTVVASLATVLFTGPHNPCFETLWLRHVKRVHKGAANMIAPLLSSQAEPEPWDCTILIKTFPDKDILVRGSQVTATPEELVRASSAPETTASEELLRAGSVH